MAKNRDRVTPYFDLFDRLDDKEIARLANVSPELVSEIRDLVEAIYDPLREFENMLKQLDNRQVAKLFGMPESAAQIWRLARAPSTLSVEARNEPGALDPIMGAAHDDDDDDLLIVLDEAATPGDGTGDGTDDDDEDDVDWGDL